MIRNLCIVVCLGVASNAVAETRVQLPTKSERRAAEVASWVTALVPVVLDVNASWHCARRVHCFTLQSTRLSVAYLTALTTKQLVHRARPCAPAECGVDNPNTSFFSAHTMLPATTLGGPRVALVLPFVVTTGGLRVAAGKHWVTDTLVGAGVGLLTSRIR